MLKGFWAYNKLVNSELHAGPNFETRFDPIHESRDPTGADSQAYP